LFTCRAHWLILYSMSNDSTHIGLYEAIHTARSLRRFKSDPVPDALLEQVLDAAIRAPSAGNAQNWAFVVVRDPQRRAALGAIYRKASRIAGAMYAARGRPEHLSDRQFQSMMSSGSHLWEHMGEAPVILIPCLRQPVVPPPESLPEDIRSCHAAEVAYAQRIRGASIYPAVQNILLTCRALGLGTTITTNHIRCEGEVRALLDLPPEFDTFAMMPIGWPIDAFGPLTRRPLSEVIHIDGWGALWPIEPDAAGKRTT
jgi:nitroreductase